jgi:hypothetical protein
MKDAMAILPCGMQKPMDSQVWQGYLREMVQWNNFSNVFRFPSITLLRNLLTGIEMKSDSG